MRYIKPSSNSVRSHESNDCTVRALASASLMSYQEAYFIMARAGRVEGAGMNQQRMINAMHMVGAKLIGVFGTTIAATHLRQLTNSHEERGIELKNFLRYFQTGRYFVLCRGHAFAVVDGELMDHGYLKSGIAVIAAWKF